MQLAVQPAPMSLDCPSCGAVYRLDAGSLGRRGRTIRCARCRSAWFATPPDDADWMDGQIIDVEPIEDDPPQVAVSPPPGKARASRPIRPGSTVLNAIAAGCVALALAGIVYRQAVVRALPETAALLAAVGLPVNLRGLEIEGLRSVEEIERGEPILIVSGTITNVSPEARQLPPLRLVIRGAEQAELYAWTTQVPEALLQPGQSTSFRARLASPPEAGRVVNVRFAGARDLDTP
jgi:predicted Zn finger-like uncharacterized protein